MKKDFKLYTESEIKYINENSKTKSTKEIADHLGRSISSIYACRNYRKNGKVVTKRKYVKSNKYSKSNVVIGNIPFIVNGCKISIKGESPNISFEKDANIIIGKSAIIVSY